MRIDLPTAKYGPTYHPAPLQRYIHLCFIFEFEIQNYDIQSFSEQISAAKLTFSRPRRVLIFKFEPYRSLPFIEDEIKIH